jgi:hypothetical protein
MTTLSILKDFIAMQTSYPDAQMLLGALIDITFGSGGTVVIFFGSGAFRAFGVVFVHGAEPFGGEFACVYNSSEASPL